jgi:formylglycine-generating enzyme required for sulfatase activity
LAHVKETTGPRVLGYVVFSGAVVVGGGVTALGGGAVGIPIGIVGIIGDVTEWVITSRNDKTFDKDNKRQFDKCCASCGLKYNDIDAAQKYIDDHP